MPTPKCRTTRNATCVSVARLVNGQQGFALGPMSGARSWAEYVAWIKANPDKAFFASSGVGSMGHLVGVVLANTSGLRIEHVAYKGSGHYNAELMGGQVSAGISGIADAADFHRSGKLRIVAVSGAERSRALPDVPTFRELGVPMDLSLWYGVFAPAGTPPAIVELLGRELVAIVAELTERFVSLGLDPAAAGPKVAAETLAADLRALAADRAAGRLSTGLDQSLMFSKAFEAPRPSAIRELFPYMSRPDMISFAGGYPVGRPVRRRRACTRRWSARCRRAPSKWLQYAATEGEPPLREALAAWMARRGIVAPVERILVTSGSGQALDLLLRVLIDRGDTILVERPSYTHRAAGNARGRRAAGWRRRRR